MATASCSVADLRLDRWLEAWCWAGPIALWCSGAKLDLLSVGNQMFAVLLLQFDESTMRIKDRKLLICLFWCPTHWTGRIGQFCNWRCTVGRRWLLQTSNDSRFRIFATMMVGWSLRTDSHPQFRLAKEEQGRKPRQHLSWWECPLACEEGLVVWLVLIQSNSMYSACEPQTHHGPWPSDFYFQRCFMVVDGRADGIKQSKLSGRYIQGLQMPFSCARLSFRPQLECPDGSSGHLRQLQYFDILQSGIPFGKPRHRSTSR